MRIHNADSIPIFSKLGVDELLILYKLVLNWEIKMRKPETPPLFEDLLKSVRDSSTMMKILDLGQEKPPVSRYLHWDQLRRYPPPADLTSEEWWLGVKMQRLASLRETPLTDSTRKPFKFCVPDLVIEKLHDIDCGSGAMINIPAPITNPQTRDQYIIRSRMEEAITSSQLEGAATTREVAKEMIRTGRSPRDKDERMIFNNFSTMQRIMDLKNQPLSTEMVFEIHRRVTDLTLDSPDGAGRFRKPEEPITVGNQESDVFHQPPPSFELPERLKLMCDFANGLTPANFIHPVVRAIILHFWLAYDHPFIDGNGRTARALFYWEMLRNRYWLFEFISISTVLRRSPIKYGLSFLYTETDGNDLTYFIVAQTKVIASAIQRLHEYIGEKTSELRELEAHLRALNLFNHRQVDLIRHALKHPCQHYLIESHKMSHSTSYETARTDLLGLSSRGVLGLIKRGRQMIFTVPKDLEKRIKKLGKEAET
jgi:Fic family protein